MCHTRICFEPPVLCVCVFQRRCADSGRSRSNSKRGVKVASSTPCTCSICSTRRVDAPMAKTHSDVRPNGASSARSDSYTPRHRRRHPRCPPPRHQPPHPHAASRAGRGGGAGSSGGITEAGRGSQGGGGAGGGSRMESGSVVHRRQVRTAHVMAVAALGLVGGAFVSLGLRRRGSKQGEGLRPPPRVVI